MIMTRRELRDSIVRIIYREAFFPAQGMDEQTEDYIRELREEPELILPSMKEEPSEEDVVYIREKVEAVLSRLKELDRLLEESSREWKINRIGKMELAIMRVAAYEIRYDDDIPDRVAINEAIELSKLYCDEKAGAFINGILNNLMEQKNEGADGAENE